MDFVVYDGSYIGLCSALTSKIPVQFFLLKNTLQFHLINIQNNLCFAIYIAHIYIYAMLQLASLILMNFEDDYVRF